MYANLRFLWVGIQVCRAPHFSNCRHVCRPTTKVVLKYTAHACMYISICGGAFMLSPRPHIWIVLHAPRVREGEKKIEFFMAMNPGTKTAQQKRIVQNNGKIIVYEDNELKNLRLKLMGHLGKFKPEEKIKPPIRLMVKWCYPINDMKKHYDGEYKITVPDLDNANKMLQDCMTACGFWENDSHVASLICEKFWAEIPGIYIRVEHIEQTSPTGY